MMESEKFNNVKIESNNSELDILLALSGFREDSKINCGSNSNLLANANSKFDGVIKLTTIQ